MLNKLAVAPLVCGCVALVVGVVPGLLDGLIDGIASFQESMNLIAPKTFRQASATTDEQRTWFLGVGLAFLVFGIFASIAST